MAERRYSVEGLVSRTDLTIRIGFPTRKADGGFECQAEIGDGRTRVVRPMIGCDAFEALLLALKNIGIELTLFSDVTSDRFTWLGGQQTGLRFPTMPDYSLDALHGQSQS